MSRRRKKFNRELYNKHLKSNYWKSLRQKAAKKSKRCYICKTTEKLQLHHKTYKRLGKEYLRDVIYLCDRCHENVHYELRQNTNTRINLWNIAKRLHREYRIAHKEIQYLKPIVKRPFEPKYILRKKNPS